MFAIASRLRVLKTARRLLAAESEMLVDCFPSSLARSRADSYAAEVLPLLDACRFLERSATNILRPRNARGEGRPFWLSGVTAVVERVPFGSVLVIGPANYPLLLPGVQTLQALAAGNAVVWKPGRGGSDLAVYFADVLRRAGLPPGVLSVTEDSAEAGAVAMEAQPDKIVFTGSSSAGRAVMLRAAESAIPVVAELSGCDACIVLPTADTGRVVDALVFAMRFNGSATCMAPRRLFLLGNHDSMLATLRERLATLPAVDVPWATRRTLAGLLAEAGVAASLEGSGMKPLLVEDGHAHMRLVQTDIMAPVLTVIRVNDVEALLTAEAQCPYGLTASIFGDEASAQQIAKRLTVGTVIINDLIVPTADPRIPFGGRRGSGHGVTRGAEGLLEMTAVKVTSVRRGASRRHYEATDRRHEALFAGLLALSHGGSLREKFHGIRTMLRAIQTLGKGSAGDKR